MRIENNSPCRLRMLFPVAGRSAWSTIQSSMCSAEISVKFIDPKLVERRDS